MMTFLCDWGAVTLFTYLDERARRRRVTWDRGFHPRIGLGGFLDRSPGKNEKIPSIQIQVKSSQFLDRSTIHIHSLDRIPQKPSTVTSRLPTAEEAEVHPQP